MEKLDLVIGVLEGLRDARARVTNADKAGSIIREYNVSFIGDDWNVLESDMLYLALNKHFELDIPDEQLHKILPLACKWAGLEYTQAGNGYLIYFYPILFDSPIFL